MTTPTNETLDRAVRTLAEMRAAFSGPMTVYRCCARAWLVVPANTPSQCRTCKSAPAFQYTPSDGADVPADVVAAELQRLP